MAPLDGTGLPDKGQPTQDLTPLARELTSDQVAAVVSFAKRHGTEVLDAVLEQTDELITTYSWPLLLRFLTCAPFLIRLRPSSRFHFQQVQQAVAADLSCLMTWQFDRSARKHEGIEVTSHVGEGFAVSLVGNQRNLV